MLAYRVRNGHDGIDQTAIARSWRGWRLPEAGRAFGGDGVTAVKDPIVRLVDGRWEAWICRHALDVPGAEDRISSAYATSDDGLRWRWHGTVLGGRPGLWDGSCRICYEARLPDESHQLRTELIPRS